MWKFNIKLWNALWNVKNEEEIFGWENGILSVFILDDIWVSSKAEGAQIIKDYI